MSCLEKSAICGKPFQTPVLFGWMYYSVCIGVLIRSIYIVLKGRGKESIAGDGNL